MSDRAGVGFDRYVARRKRAAWGGEAGARYAYSADIAMLHAFKRIRPIEMAAAATVRMYKEVLKNQLLGQCIKVTPKQFPSIHAIAEHCAARLDVPVPTIYVANNPNLNAYTFGTDEDAFIVVHSALIDHYEEDELQFVIGHETGHIQNKHVVYNTLLNLLRSSALVLLRWIVPPVDMALQAWYRRAEVTCDRAGLLCAGSMEAGARSFLKLACGSRKLYQELDVNEYLRQADEGREGIGRLTELFASHPYLPKRLEAMGVFAQSEMFREAMGLGPGGLSIEEVDAKTSDIIQIVKGKKREASETGGDAAGGDRDG